MMPFLVGLMVIGIVAYGCERLGRWAEDDFTDDPIGNTFMGILILIGVAGVLLLIFSLAHATGLAVIKVLRNAF